MAGWPDGCARRYDRRGAELLAEDVSYITGQVINVDGGMVNG